MRRISLVIVLGALLATASVSARQSSSEICVKSDTGNAFIVFNSQTGDYKFVRCDGVAFSGTGQIKKDGCLTTLDDTRANYTVVTTVNVCEQVAKAFVDVPQPTATSSGTNVPQMQESFRDSNLRDNICDCTSGGSGTGGDGNPGFIGPPVEGGSPQPSGGRPDYIGPPDGGPGPEPSTTPGEFCIQSDTNGNLLVFNTQSGAYKFVRWDGTAFSGTGQVTKDGCFIMLEDKRDNYNVFASVNTCDQNAKGFVNVPQNTTSPTGTNIPAMQEGFADGDLRNTPCGGGK